MILGDVKRPVLRKASERVAATLDAWGHGRMPAGVAYEEADVWQAPTEPFWGKEGGSGGEGSPPPVLRVRPDVEVRQAYSRSWLDPVGARVLGREFHSRLVARAKGKVGRFLTLTYDRTMFKGPEDLWESEKREQHLALFMRRLGRHLGRDLSGQWIAKCEFQEGGWLHFHVILLGVRWIDHAHLRALWGYGFTHVDPLTPECLRYQSKYLFKDGRMPMFLQLADRVRVIRTSRGFWGESVTRPRAERDPFRPVQRFGCVPVGVRLMRKVGQTLVRGCCGSFSSLRLPVARVVLSAVAEGARVVPARPGWVGLRYQRGRTSGRPAAAGARALHLIPNQYRDADGDLDFDWWVADVQRWLERPPEYADSPPRF